ncbi:DUF3883 domain-containing protein [Pseudoduganella lutea]|uniref:DUF3883 domain-containing protein n=1 Tax=Pseudoduganella lutea TaxID=321985 RepID=A0A4P6KRL1_9BURK|nr:DUF3883 domain-containing protein [Pseudoduganella lutea]QBE61721.1 DUF3883 domain-containing protein [Pseudoduganella lutea]
MKNKPISPDAVRRALAEFDDVGRSYFHEKYAVPRSREYMLREPVSGKLYDVLAVTAAVARSAGLNGEPVNVLTNGEDDAGQLLVDLGFEVVRVGLDWSSAEVEATVADYFEMLKLESLGAPYSKAEHNEQLRKQLTTRSRSSIELKHQNISAVLDQMQLPYIRGYKPRGNLQALLRETVLRHVDRHREALQAVMDNFDAQVQPGEERYIGVLVERPQVVELPAPQQRTRLPRKLDYAAREERNRLLGRGGEAWTVHYEQARLAAEGRPDLAGRIDWISDRLGDGAGYDILSYERSEVTRFIEVKTTNAGPLAPFIVTRNELTFSEEFPDAFCLYRLFEFASAPRLFVLRGPLADHVQLEAIDFRARLKAV